MKLIKITIMSLIALGSLFALTFAAGEAEKGKALFNDPNFAGGVKACSSCHPDGKGLEKAADRPQKRLEEAVNTCIVHSIQGKAIDVKSAQMKAIVEYIKSLKPKKPVSGY